MSNAADIKISQGLSDRYRSVAAEMYYEAFGQKFRHIAGPRDVGVRVLEDSFVSDMAIIAECDGELAGLAGMQFAGREFVNWRYRDLVKHRGTLRGTLGLLLGCCLAQEQGADELLLESMAVRSDMRGRGIGTLLLSAVEDYAREHAFAAVRLDVVGTNPGAQRLYERVGYKVVESVNTFYLRRLMGFGNVTIMRKDLEKIA